MSYNPYFPDNRAWMPLSLYIETHKKQKGVKP